jgi:HAD superfamily hydrolase (TIGR01509 family)
MRPSLRPGCDRNAGVDHRLPDPSAGRCPPPPGPGILPSVYNRLQAVVLDVDGTLVDSERDGHRVAFNLAFEELGLPHRWDPAEYGELLHITGGERRLRTYLGDHGVADPERDDLARRLHRRKTELFQGLVEDGRVRPRPGVPELLDDLAGDGVRLGVATTGSRAWVEPLLARLFGLDRFEVVVTGDDVAVRKPDPTGHLMALEGMGIAPGPAAVGLEDSRNGFVAAKSADLPCVVVVNDYTRDQNFEGAELVLEGFGADGPPGVVDDPFGLAPPGRLDAATFRRVAAAAAG